MLLNPQTFPDGADRVTTNDNRTIHYLAVVPLLPEEMAFKEDHDSDALEGKLFDAGLTELVDPERSSVV
jgi:hypothetical protein